MSSPPGQHSGRPSFAADPASDPSLALRARGAVLSTLPTGLVVPRACACCGAPACCTRAETRASDEAVIIVPYCNLCHAHAAATSTRLLGTALASCLLAGTLAAVLPLLLPGGQVVLLTAAAVCGGTLPLIAGSVWRRRPMPGHTSSGRAVWWRPGGELCCSNGCWADELARLNALVSRPAFVRDRPFSGWVLAGLVLAAIATPFFAWLYRPLVRVVNLTPVRITVLVDGAAVASLEPTSAESPSAGVELHLPAGVHRLVAQNSRKIAFADDSVVVRAGRQHLYAPASSGYCFWLETVGYGRTEPERATVEPLVDPSRFWVLPRIDVWFAPPPAPSPRDDRSSGGVLTTLRQARCQHAPAAVQAATGQPPERTP